MVSNSIYLKTRVASAGVAAMVAAVTGCSDDFLDVVSPTQDTIETYFTTEEHLQEAVVAAYDPIHWPDWAMGEYNPVNIMADVMADDIWVGGSDKTDNDKWHLMFNYETIPSKAITGLWKVAYSGVKRANDVIAYADWVVGLSDDEKAAYVAQARVLRAFYYNWLWKFWGNIPFFMENLTTPYIAEQKQADDVYQAVISDLEQVIEQDVLPMRETAANYGRVTQAMAMMLHAEMVLYQNDESRYAKALSFMNKIIDSGKYDLMADYADIFEVDGEWSSESIFEVNYKSENAARSYDNPLYAGGTVLPRLISPNGWPDGTGGMENGWGFAPVRTETFDLFDPSDARRDATCWNAQADADAAGKDYNKRYQDTGLFLRKYTARSGGNSGQIADADLNYSNNLRIYRYSETLLNAAELIVRGAGSGDAKALLNKVRNRAGLPDADATIDNIIDERRLEFVGEGKRYWDLIRTGKATDALVPDSYGFRTNAWTSSKKYLPIPQIEIDAANGTLTQNNY